MWKRFCGVLLVVAAAGIAASCQTARKAAAPTPEADQEISEALKNLYMAASAAPPQSAQQQKIILQMAEKASNGKELLLVMRASDGVFRPADSAREQQVESLLTAKMMELATLDQLIDYEAKHAVETESARPYVQRMFDLGDGNSDPRVWYRIRAAALHLKVEDLERQAQVRADQLAGR